jgi:CRP-like cAMP-binding protein/tetratricopeptide (TPR) repeat protein
VLHLSGEHVFPVQPLPQDDAVALFLTRAREGDTTSEQAVGARDDIREICRRLDGLPLAIELAAARTRLLSPGQLLERLRESVTVLAAGPRDLPARQQTLRDTLAWSVELLAPAERRSLADLSVFSGGWSLDAAQQVAGADLDRLGTLVDHSLVQPVPGAEEPRFRMLETVREYAAEHLGDRRPELEQRHAEFFAELADEAELRGPDQQLWLDRLDREHDNLRVTLDQAAAAQDPTSELRLVSALWRFWWLRGELAEGRSRLEHAIARGSGAAPALVAQACAGAAGIAWSQGVPDRAAELARDGLRASDVEGGAVTAISCHTVLGLIGRDAGEFDEARAHLEQSQALAASLGREADVNVARMNLGSVAFDRGHYDEAVALWQEVLAHHRERGAEEGTAIALLNLGLAAHRLDDPPDARERFAEAERLFDRIGFREYQVHALHGLAAVAAVEGRGEEVATLLGRAAGLLAESGSPGVPFAADLAPDAESRARAQIGDEAFAAAFAAKVRRATGPGPAELPWANRASRMDTAITDTPRNRPRYTQILNRVSAELSPKGAATAIQVVPFVRGRRPTDEARHPGLGSSDHAALVLGDEAVVNRAYVLYTLPDEHAGLTVDVTLSLTGYDGTADPVELPGWQRRPVELRCFDASGDGSIRAAEPADTRFVLAVDPDTDLVPARAGAGDDDPYGFGHLFLQQLRVDLRLSDGGREVSTAGTSLDVADVRRLGSLYSRVLERVLSPDVARQAAAAGVARPGNGYHPCFPVLLIGSDKASLYTRGLVADIVHKQRHLAEPGWLLRVGVFLELLTCLGIADAVRDDVGDLLTPAERSAYESERFAPLRSRVDAEAWRAVWDLREIAFPKQSIARAGPVSLLNLMRKKRATLEFLHVHHEDLKQAIELAGPNRFNAQETWQRVFRDAERAVLRQTSVAFPELGYLPRPARDLVLWHRQARLESVPLLRVPKVVARLMHDQDGLFAAACNQYRASMNAVAEWAKERALMNPAGNECIPQQVSLLEAYMEHPERIAALQRRDGYGPSLDVSDPLDAEQPPPEDAEQLLRALPLFRMLAPEELGALARAARPLALGPMERFAIQGTAGTSLFVVADGEVEVVLRREVGPDLKIATLGRGEVVGEMSLLTGEPRAASVRAVDGALVYEIGQAQYAPLLQTHREWVEELAVLMEQRLRQTEAHLAAYDAQPQRREIRRRIVRHFFSSADGAPYAAAPAD